MYLVYIARIRCDREVVNLRGTFTVHPPAVDFHHPVYLAAAHEDERLDGSSPEVSPYLYFLIKPLYYHRIASFHLSYKTDHFACDTETVTFWIKPYGLVGGIPGFKFYEPSPLVHDLDRRFRIVSKIGDDHVSV